MNTEVILRNECKTIYRKAKKKKLRIKHIHTH